MLPRNLSPAANVLRTSASVASASAFVGIDGAALSSLAASVRSKSASSTVQWDESDWHFVSAANPEHTALYVLALDALNFCFWPSERGELQYHHVATALTAVARASEATPEFAFHPRALAALTPDSLAALLRPHLPVPLPALGERCRLLNELGVGLAAFYNSEALELIGAAGGSADKLTFLIASTFSGFRDTCVDPVTGQQLFFYKRAQICVGDL